MDADRFDTLLRFLSSSPSRRHTLRLLAGAAVAAPSLVGGRVADAKGGKKGKDKGKGCSKGQKKCGKKCIPKGNCCTYVDCTGCRNEDCINGKCQCSPENIFHNGMCGFFINCKSFGETCATSDDCCSARCNADDTGQARCSKGIGKCITDSDCLSGPCIGWACPETNEPYFDLCR